MHTRNERRMESFAIKIRDESPTVRTFTLEGFGDIPSEPGQYLMIGLEDGGEKPFSLSGKDSITVKKIASTVPGAKTFTERMFERKDGDTMLASRPRGNGFSSGYRWVGIGGGYGLAPLKYELEKDCAHSVAAKGYIKMFAGGKTAKDVIFKERFGELSEFFVATEDGSAGKRGTVLDLLKDKKPWLDTGWCYHVCGPPKMERVVADWLVDIGIPAENIECSAEGYMKCGEGLCRSCDVGGYSVCRDGSVFRYTELKGTDFGKRKRAKSGRLIDI